MSSREGFDWGGLLMFVVGAVLGGALVYAYMRDNVLPEMSVPAAPYSYSTLESQYYGWPVTEPEDFVGAPGRCWIGEDGIATFDETGVRVPSETKPQSNLKGP